MLHDAGANAFGGAAGHRHDAAVEIIVGLVDRGQS